MNVIEQLEFELVLYSGIRMNICEGRMTTTLGYKNINVFVFFWNGVKLAYVWESDRRTEGNE